MSCWRSGAREPSEAASATVSGRVPAASRVWVVSAPRPTPAGAATTWCVGTAVPTAPTAPGAAKCAPRRREYPGTSGRDSAHPSCSLPPLGHPSLMLHGQPFLAQLVFSSTGQLSLLSVPRVGTHGWVMENWLVLHTWSPSCPPCSFSSLTLACPLGPHAACVSSTPGFLPLDLPCSTKPILLLCLGM